MRLECPGLCDLQVNGFAGVDFNAPGLSADRVRFALQQLRLTGVTRLCRPSSPLRFDDFAACARALADVEDPAIAGIHMEGPYISSEDGARGAHPRAHVVAARRDDFERRQEAARGRIVLVTLAPEVEGAIALIEWLVTTGVRVAIGHTAATGDQIAAAVSAGATLSTHLGNGCPVDPAATPQRDLGAARRRRTSRQRHRRRASPAAGNREVHRAREGCGADDPRHRRDGGRRKSPWPLPDRRRGMRARRRRPCVASRNRIPRRLEPDPRSRDREHRQYTGLPIEDVIRMASQTSGELPRHRAGRDRERRLGRTAISSAEC